MNKKILLATSLFILFSECHKKETTRLENYLKLFHYNIYDYKVICIVPADGFGICINPSLTYAKDPREDFLLVLSSKYKKSIEHTVERLQIYNEKFISDSQDLANEMGLVSIYSPCYYFLRYGKVVKKIDLSETGNKTEIIDEVEQYFIAEDAHLKEMQEIEILSNQK